MMRLSNLIYKASIKYVIPANVFTAILMQESKYQVTAERCTDGYRIRSKIEMEYYLNECTGKVVLGAVTPENYEQCETNAINQRVRWKTCTDFGISQISHKTVDSYKFDIELLTSDLEYSINAGAKVLAWFFKTYYAKEEFWYLRYNCGTRGKVTRKSCMEYGKQISKYL